MRRRTILTACGVGVAGLAGCTDDTRSRTRTDNRTDPPATATTPTPEPSVTATFDSLQPARVALDTDYLSISAAERQHLFVAVESEGRLARDAFAFQFDGETYAPLEPLARGTYRAYGDGAYSEETSNGWLLFSLPEQGDGSTARLSWPGGEWTPDESVRTRLAAPEPPMAATVSMPEQAENGSAFTLSVEVTNEGDIGGRFVAAVSRYGPQVAATPVERVSAFVPPGESITRTYSQTLYADTDDVGDGESDATYEFQWVGGGAERSVGLT